MKKITAYVIILLILVVAIYDGYAIYKGGTEASISHVILIWTYKYPPVTFVLGYLMGHLTWRIRDTKDTKELGR